MAGQSKSARHKVMDLLARRTYAEVELREKLAEGYADEDIDDAIRVAKESGWLPSPEDVSEQLVTELTRKGKGSQYINQILESKGLPPIQSDFESEVEKARALLQSKLKLDLTEKADLAPAVLAKAQRLLASRGFDDDVIVRVLPSTL